MKLESFIRSFKDEGGVCQREILAFSASQPSASQPVAETQASTAVTPVCATVGVKKIPRASTPKPEKDVSLHQLFL